MTRRLRLERLALKHVKTSRFPLLKRKGFHAAVRSACYSEYPDQGIGIIPDGWFVEGDSEAATFTCIEIEDANPLSPEKVLRYGELYDLLDFCDHQLRLFVFDRYGHSERELDLPRVFLSSLVEMYGPDEPVAPPDERVSIAQPAGYVSTAVSEPQTKGATSRPCCKSVPYTKKGLSGKFRKWCREAGLPHHTMHGLRMTYLIKRVEAGASVEQLLRERGESTQ